MNFSFITIRHIIWPIWYCPYLLARRSLSTVHWHINCPKNFDWGAHNLNIECKTSSAADMVKSIGPWFIEDRIMRSGNWKFKQWCVGFGISGLIWNRYITWSWNRSVKCIMNRYFANIILCFQIKPDIPKPKHHCLNFQFPFRIVQSSMNH